MNRSQRVGKNVAWMLMAGGLGSVLQMVAVLLAARGLSLNDFGTFNYLLSLAIVFQFLTDFGLTNILTREVARHPDDIAALARKRQGPDVGSLFLLDGASPRYRVAARSSSIDTGAILRDGPRQSYAPAGDQLFCCSAGAGSDGIQCHRLHPAQGIVRRFRWAESRARLGLMGSGPLTSGGLLDLLVFQLADCELARDSGFAQNRYRPLEIHARGGGATRQWFGVAAARLAGRRPDPDVARRRKCVGIIQRTVPDLAWCADAIHGVCLAALPGDDSLRRRRRREVYSVL